MSQNLSKQILVLIKKIRILELIFKVKGEKQEEESTAPPCSNRLPLQLAAF